MSVVVRAMTAEDIDAVFALDRTTPEVSHWPRSAYEDCVSPAGAAATQRAGFIAEADGRIIGVAIVRLLAGVAELEAIMVAKQARRNGLGRALLEVVLDWARQNEASRTELEVRVSNAAAIRLYEQAGFFREGLRPDYYRNPVENAVLMGLNLLPISTGGKPA